MNEVIRKMAESLRAGATMLPDNCPVCNSPLFRLKNKTFCVRCGSSPDVTTATSTPSPPSQIAGIKAIAPKITSTVLARLRKLEAEINETSDSLRLSQLSELMLKLLRILEILERLNHS